MPERRRALAIEPLEDRRMLATFSETGGALNIGLQTSEALGIVSNGPSYTMTLTGGADTWSGTNDTRVSTTGSTLTVTALGIIAFAAGGIDITDSAGNTGTSVAFNDSGAFPYLNNFTIGLHNSPALPGLIFNGASTFNTNTLTANVDTSISVNSGADISTTSGDITLEANQQATPTSGNFVGVDVSTAAITSATGAVLLKGKGGDTGDQNFGIKVEKGATILSTGTAPNAATLTLEGTGGNGGTFNFGVWIVDSATQVTSQDGAVQITGQGGDGTGSENDGIVVSNGAVVSSTGTTPAAATLTLDGTGGSGTNNSFGVLLQGNGASTLRVTSVDGAVQITGQGGAGPASYGIYAVQAAVVSSTGTTSAAATLTLNGTGGTGSDSNFGVFIENSGTQVTAVDGAIQITGSGGTGTNNRAIDIEDSGAVTSTGTGTVGLISSNTTTYIGATVSAASAVPTVTDGSLYVDYTAGANVPNGLAFTTSTSGATLTLNDAGGAASHTYAITDTRVTRDGAAPISYTGALASLTVDGSSDADSAVNVQSTAADVTTTNWVGGANNTVNIGDDGTVGSSPGNLAGILGAVSISNTTGTTALTVDDSTGTSPQTGVTVTSTYVSGFTGVVTISYANLSSLTLDGGSGQPVQLIVDSSNGAIPFPITFDGGTGTGSSLVLQGGTATSDTYSPGPGTGQGTDTLVISGVKESVSFVNLAPVFDHVAGPLAVNGTTGDDTITASPAASNQGIVTVNDLESITFNNKTSLTLNGLAGNDAFNISPVGMSLDSSGAITVNGAAGATDSVTVKGTAAIEYNPTAAKAGNVVTAGPTVFFTNIAGANIVGDTANDTLTYNARASFVNRLQYTPGPSPDTGTISEHIESGTDLAPLSFANLGTDGSVVFDNSGGRLDTLDLYGTSAAKDEFIASGADVQIVDGGIPALYRTVLIKAPGVSDLNLHGLGGGDTFDLTGPLPYANTLVDSGDPGVANLSFATGAVNVTLGAAGSPTLVTGYGGTVTLAGVDVANLGANFLPVTVDDANANTNLAINPAGARAATVEADGAAPQVNIANAATSGLTVTLPGDGNSSVTVNGTAGDDTITTALGATTTVNVNSLLPINLTAADTQSLVLSGGPGNDTYNFTGAGGPGNITVAGGSGKNTINLAGAAAGFDTFIVNAGNNGSSGTTSFTGSPSIGFSGVENIGITGGTGASNEAIILNGTSANDVFTVTPGGFGATGTGTAQINAGPAISFSKLGTGIASLTLNGGGGSDTFDLTQAPAATAIPAVRVMGGATSSASISDSTAGDAFTYAAGSPSSGTVADSAGTIYFLSGLSNLAVVGAPGNPLTTTLNVTNANAVVTPGTATGSGAVAASDTANNALLPLNYSNILGTSGAAGTLVVGSTVDNSTVTVDANGDVTVTNNQFGTNVYHAGTYSNLVLNVSGNNTQVTIDGSADFAGGVQVFGTGTTAVTVNATASPVITDFAVNQILAVVAGAISLNGVSSVSVNGVPGTNMFVTGYGAPTDITDLTLANANTIDVGASGTINTYNYTSESSTAATLSLASGGPTINITGFNNTPGNLMLAGTAAIAVNVIGSSGNDQFTVSQAGTSTRVLQTSGSAWVPVDLAGFGSLRVSGGDGDDTLTVDSTAGAVMTPIVFDGGTGSNSLSLADTVNTATSDVYAAGPLPGQGTDTLVIGGNTESVQFTNLAPVTDNVAGPLTVDGTSGNDAITAGATANVVTVNNLESITFANKTSLTLNGSGGDDTFNISPANITLAGAGPITANGAAGGDDSLTINGNKTIGYSPTGPGAGIVNTAGNPTVAFTNISSAAIVGDAAGDTLTITPSVAGEISYTAGPTFDSGSLTFGTPLAVSLTPLQFSNLGSGSLAIADAAGGIDVNGPNSASEFNVSPAGVVQIFKPLGTDVEVMLPITATAAAVRLIGHSGNDTFNVPGNQPFSLGGLEVEGAAGNNTLNVTGDGTAPITVDLGAGTVTETGFSPVTYLGVGTVNVNGGGAAVTVVDDNENTNMAITPTGPAAATVAANGTGPLVNVAGASASGLITNLTGSGDTLTISGRATGQPFTITNSSVTVGSDLPVDYTASQLAGLDLRGGAGDDTFTVNPGLTTPTVIDGGLGSNTLNTSGAGTFSVYSGSASDVGSLSTPDNNGNNLANISFTGVQTINLNGTGTNDNLLIFGTGGNDVFTQEETGVTVNDGPAIGFNPFNTSVSNAGFTQVTLNGAGGKDRYDLNPSAVGDTTTLNVMSDVLASGSTMSVTAAGQHDALTVVPTAAGNGSVTDTAGGTPLGFVTYSGIAGIDLVGQTGDGDTANVAGTKGNDTLTYTPGADGGSGTITGTLDTSDVTFNGPFALPTVTFSQMSPTGPVGLFGTANGGNDAAIIDGASGDDIFTVDQATGAATENGVAISTGGATTLTLNGLAGDNTYTITGSATPQFSTIDVNGSGLADPDVLNLIGDGSQIKVNMDGATPSITGGGFGTIDVSGVANVKLDAKGGPVTVSGTSQNDSFTYTPESADEGLVQAGPGSPLFDISDLRGAPLTIDAAAGANTVTVNGSSGNDSINVARGATTTVQVNALMPVSIVSADTQSLVIASGTGTDTINVTGSAGPALTVLGGQTPGAATLNVTNSVAGDTTYTPGATNDAGTLANADGTINFAGMELVSDTASAASDALIILGTSGDDTITAANVQGDNRAWVNAQAPILFARFGTLILNGRGGNDNFIVSPVGLTSVTTLDVDAASGADNRVTINGSNAADSINYSPTAPAGSGTVAITGSATVSLANIATLAIDGHGGGDALTVTTPSGADTVTYSPGAATDAGAMAIGSLLPLGFSNLGSSGSVTLADASGTRLDNLVVNGAVANDNFAVSASGTISLNSQLAVSTPGVKNLTLNGLVGDNSFTVNAPTPFSSITVNGSGLSESDVLNLNGNGSPITVNLSGATPSISGGDLGTVDVSGVGMLNVNANGGGINFNGASGDDSLAVTSTGANSATVQDNGGGPIFNVTGAASFNVDLLGGNNTLVVNGSAGNDTITARTNAAANPTVTVAQAANSDLPISYVATDLAALDINGLDGADTLIVDSTNGPLTTPIVFDGGNGNNSLTLQGGAAGSDTYTPGPGAGQGADVLNFAPAGRESVHFLNLSPVLDLVAGPLVVTGTNGNDAINYAAGSVAANGKVTINNLESIEFSNKTSLAIDSLAGNDSINLNNPSKPTGLASITVDGGDPTASTDTLIVNGAVGAGPVAYSPTAADGGSITGAGPVPITLAHIEQLQLNDQALGDKVTVNGTGGNNDTFIATPGAADDAGTIALNSLLPLAYQNLGAAGSTNVSDTGTNNTLVVNGTPANDTFGVAGTTGTVTLNSRVPISETGIQNLKLNGLGGADSFILQAPLPYAAVAVNGGNSSNGDALVLNGTNGTETMTVSLGDSTTAPPMPTAIGGFGGVVSLTNVAQVYLNGNGGLDTLTVNGTPHDDQITYQPTSASGGNFNLAGLNTNFTFNLGGAVAAGAFTINGGGNIGGDQVNVRGPNAGSTFIADEPDRIITVSNAAGTNLMPVALGADVQVAELDAGIGNNTFLVAPAQGVLLPGKSNVVGQPNFQVPNNLLVNIVGGGSASQNALIVAAYNAGTGQASTLAQSLFAVDNRTSDSAGTVRLFQNDGADPIQYPDISYSGVGTVSPDTYTNVATHQQQTLTLGPDVYDPNGSLNNAAYLGSGATINATNLAIFPNAFEHKFLQAEQDWFRVVAQSTGTMDFQIYFNQFAGFLPGNGELQIQVYGAAGNPIAEFGVNDQTSDQRRRIPVVAGETYYLQVYGVSQDATKFPQNSTAPDVFDPNNATVNGYNLSIINTPAPAPDALGLDNVVAQGTVNNTMPATTTTLAASNAPTPPPVIPPNFQTQPLPPLSSLDNFYVGTYLEFTSGALVGQRELVSGYVAATHTFTFASPFSAAPAVNDTFQIESDDTGRSQLDNVTRDSTPTIYIRLDAANTPGDGLIDLDGGGDTSQTPPNNVPVPIPFWAGNAAAAPNSPANNGSFRVAVYDETNPQSPVFLGYADAVAGQTGVFQLPVATPLADGTHNLVAKVEMDSASTPSNHDVGTGVSLSIVVDTQAPPVYFGSPTVADSGLYGSSDTGVAGQPATIADRITTDSTPTLYGVAEANAIVRLYVSTPNGNVLIGQSTATPIDGTNQDPNGQWTITSTTDLNNPSLGLPHDGVRNIFVTAEDAAGNVSAPQELTIFLDTQGPQVGNVSVTGNPGYNLFAGKPILPTPTPLVNALDVTFSDQPIRVGPNFAYPAVNPTLATTIANYQLVGKNHGPVEITSVTLTDLTAAGSAGKTVATLHFAAPLADDQYTLSISDKIEDNAGNPLDGEFNGATFPSGNTNAGGVFSGTFVVNSHPHLAVYSGGSVSLDINGDGVFDPSTTVTNSDVVESFGYASDRLFSGNFASPTGFVSGFDELGAYGFVNNQWRWLVNWNPATGTSSPATFIEPLAIDGAPVAGYFAGNPALGMQVGLFDGTTWYLDVLNHHTIDQADLNAGGQLGGDMRGYPLVGDFDGDGKTDLATYQNGVFYFDLSSKEPGGKLTGNYNATISVQSLIPNNIGFSSVTAQPVAADIDQDGITDVGLYVPGRTENAPAGQAEWYWLVSNDAADAHGVNPAGAFASLDHAFNPTPLGHDLFYQFGNQFAIPLVGIWDPPAASTGTSSTQTDDWITGLYQTVLGRQPTTADATGWNNLLSTAQISAQQTALEFLESDERLSTIINGLYKQYLGRAADQDGLNYWIGIWQNSGGEEQVQAGIIGSPEFFATAAKNHPSMSPAAAWVTALYNNILGRAPDTDGLNYWVNYIQTHSLGSVVLGFVTSDEYRWMLVNGWFEEYLGRSLEPRGAEYWLEQMKQGLTQDQLQVAVLCSAEFQNKFASGTNP